MLSTLHQSSLGSLYLIVPSKLHPLWYTPLLPYFFLISAIGAGMAMTILESYLSKRAFERHLEMDVLEPLARGMVVALLEPGYEARMFVIEMTLGVVLPVGLLLIDRIRTNPTGLVVAALFAVLGFVMNRLNVSVTGMEGAAGVQYVPSWMEVTVSLGLVALGFALFTAAVRYLPIFPEPASRRVG
jgi:Ni/Fe-hydrogenase subunit HybB-like protein